MSPAFWSLTPEAVFYVMLPFVILWLPGLKARLALFVVLVLAAIPTQAMTLIHVDEKHVAVAYGEFDPFEFYASFPTTLLYLFVAGMLVRMLVERLDVRPVTALRTGLLLLAFVISAAFLLSPQAFTFLSVNAFGQTAAKVMWQFLNHSMLILFFIAAVLGAPLLRRLLDWKPLAFVGLISYSMFVFHQTVLLYVVKYVLRGEWFAEWVARSTLHTWGGFLIYMVAVYAVVGLVAYLGFRFIESPFLRLKPK
jgi:peptidoglycan/LPS O-acetylase OafA/YrhL